MQSHYKSHPPAPLHHLFPRSPQPVNGAYGYGSPAPAVTASSPVPANALNIPANHALFLIVFIGSLIFLGVALISLLIAQFSYVLTNAFTRKSDFLLERLRACMLLDSMTRSCDRFPRNPEDRYWVQFRSKQGDGEAEGRALPRNDKSTLRPYFLWQSFKKSPWVSDVSGKNLAREAVKEAVARKPPPGGM